MQTEVYNNSSNIDIIGIDVGKESTIPLKGVSHMMPHHIEKPITMPIIPEHSQPLLYDQKNVKDMYPEYSKVHENHNCAICGEGFGYVTALAQHYSLRHKGYDP